MAEIKLTKEQIEALQKFKAKEEFAKENRLTDEELEKVVGGGASFDKSFSSTVTLIKAAIYGKDVKN